MCEALQESARKHPREGSKNRRRFEAPPVLLSRLVLEAGGADESQIPPASSLGLFRLEKKVEYLPAFSLTWFVGWTPILNGERVVIQVDPSRNDNTTDFEVPEFKSRPPHPWVAQSIPPGGLWGGESVC
jgi:hypothetical protein